jgi:HlyD family secretion protein
VVEVARAAMGPLQVTVDAEGMTRVRDRYVVAAPVAGRVARIELREGDPVAAGAVVARVFPAPLDVRSRQEATARVEAAADAHRAAQAALAQARAARDQSRRDLDRARQLQAGGLLAADERERAELLATTREREVESAAFRAQSAEHDVQAARAALLAEEGHAIPLTAPSAGRVLRIPERSERVVAAGTPLLEVGDPARIEIVADLLSSDAVKVRPAQVVLIEGWGGDSVLRGRVRTIEPSGFTKVSALGVEEQRVNVVADLADSSRSLGDRYRVEIRIIVSESARVLTVPASALFRSGTGWAVFVVERGRARRREVSLGRRTPSDVEIVQGVREGDTVVRIPGDQVAEGARITPRVPPAPDAGARATPSPRSPGT